MILLSRSDATQDALLDSGYIKVTRSTPHAPAWRLFEQRPTHRAGKSPAAVLNNSNLVDARQKAAFGCSTQRQMIWAAGKNIPDQLWVEFSRSLRTEQGKKECVWTKGTHGNSGGRRTRADTELHRTSAFIIRNHGPLKQNQTLSCRRTAVPLRSGGEGEEKEGRKERESERRLIYGQFHNKSLQSVTKLILYSS